MASEMTGFGKSIDSSTIGCFSSHSVSPVETLLRPTAAAMSPAYTSLISSRLFACIFKQPADALAALLGGVVDASSPR